jgi:hypothetical protein
MKYAIAATAFIIGNEVLSLLTVAVIAYMLVFDFFKKTYEEATK